MTYLSIARCDILTKSIYRNMPIKGAPPNKGTPYGFKTQYTLHSDQNRLKNDGFSQLFITVPLP